MIFDIAQGDMKKSGNFLGIKIGFQQSADF